MDNLHLEGVSILWPNFRGAKGLYNEAGVRTFNILLNDLDLCKDLISIGWALKPLKNEDGVVDAYHLPVKVNFDSRRPPRVYKVSLSTETQLQLDEKTISMLDYLPIDYVDVIVSPYHWEARGETGIKAYLQTMYAIIEENELDLKWAQLSSSEK